MKNYIFTLLLIGWSFLGNSQINGKVLYNKAIQLNESNLNIDPDKLRNSVQQLTYVLEFTSDYSVFYLEEQLDSDSDTYARMAKRIGNSSGVFFKDIKEEFTLQELSMFNKEFLVRLDIPEFHIAEEVGEISGFKVLKATGLETAKAPSPGLKDLEKPVVVWFTPDIPVPYGPGRYNGLPGLILKISVGNVSFTASEIKMNDNNKAENLISPDKSKPVITEKEFHEKLRAMVENL